MLPEFDPQPVLESDLLHLRPLTAADIEPLYEVAKNPKVWAGHPKTDRYQRDVFEPYFTMLLNSASTLVVCLKETGQVIGC